MKTPDSIDGSTMLPDLFQAVPEARTIFNRYGLRGCGGGRGPAESLAFFASTHGVPPEALLKQVRDLLTDAKAREQAREQLAVDAAPRLSDAIYRPFFLAAMAVVLTAGAAWGVLLLWKIGFRGSFTEVSVHEVNAHGHAQIMGWVGLFIMGFAYQAFPRMWQVELPAPWLSVVVWLGTLVGIAARSTAMFFSGAAWAMPLHAFGGALEILAVGAFLAQIGTAFQRSGLPVKPYVGFIFSALAFLLVQAAYSTWHMHQLLTAVDREALLRQISGFQAPLRDLQVHGMAMLMILGVGQRMFPSIFGLAEVPGRRGWTGLVILVTAILTEASLFLVYRSTGNHVYAAALLIPWLLFPIGVGLVVGPWRLWRPLHQPGQEPERSAKFVRIAFGWLFISFAMLALLPVYQAISHIPFSHAYYGAIRHAVTVGFVSMMIVGMAAKVVPTLRGIPPAQLPALWAPFFLINLGCFLRVSFQVGTDWNPVFFKLIGISGMLEWTGLAIWSVHLAAIMLGWGSYKAPSQFNGGPAPREIRPEHKVAAVLAWHPQLERIFIQQGFALIKNPVLRRTLATQVSIHQACQIRGVNESSFLEALRQAA